MKKGDWIEAVQKKSEKTCDHTSVGIIVKKDQKILLIQRKKPPFGFAPPAGHVDDHGSFEQAAKDELREEVGLTVTNLKLIYEAKLNNYCRRKDGTWHLWKWYEAETKGEIKRSLDETEKAGWYTNVEIKALGERTKEYLAGKISDKKWQQNPGLESLWLELLGKIGI